MFLKPLTVLFLTVSFSSTIAQINAKKYRPRLFQLSLLPGISTNGTESGSFYNKYSLNIFGGLSAGNEIIEVGLLTNVNIVKTTGIQISSLGNIVAANKLLNPIIDLEKGKSTKDKECLAFNGIQLSGLLNFIGDKGKGIQISAVSNVVRGYFEGFQMSGLGNSVGGEYLSGIQIASLYNLTDGDVSGWQVSLGFNYARNRMSGAQIGVVNKARVIYSRKSTPPSSATGMQIGLINFTKAMDGLQIGLVNFGGAVRGKQIGIINFFQREPSKKNVRMGTPIGLLNIGTSGTFFRISTNETLTLNAEVSTGNCMNCTWTQSGMPYHDRFTIYNQNSLIVGHNNINGVWGIGYGFQKVLYSKASMLPVPANEKTMLSYGVNFIHLSGKPFKLDNTFNLLTRINGSAGIRLSIIYLFAGMSVNFFVSDVNSTRESNGLSLLHGQDRQNWSLSMGYHFGLQYRPNF